MEKTFKLSKDSKLKQILLNYREEDLPRYLYHYTSFASFFYALDGIGKSVKYSPDYFTFHASAVKSMDDLAETELFDKVLKEVKSAQASESWSELFILSLSEAEDNMMMWETYADHGKGLCLKLDVKQLLENPIFFYSANEIKEMIEILPNGIKEGGFKEYAYLAKCQYNIDNHDFEKYKQLITDFEETKDPVAKMNSLRKVRLHSAIFKKAGYESEKEWRLLIDCSNILFKQDQRMGVSAYTEFKMPIKALSGIILGPRAEEQHQSYILKLLRSKTDILSLNNIETSKMAGKILKY